MHIANPLERRRAEARKCSFRGNWHENSISSRGKWYLNIHSLQRYIWNALSLPLYTLKHLQLPTNTAAPWHLALCWQATKAVGALTFNGNPILKSHLNPYTHIHTYTVWHPRMSQMQLQLEYMYIGSAATPTQMANVPGSSANCKFIDCNKCQHSFRLH